MVGRTETEPSGEGLMIRDERCGQYFILIGRLLTFGDRGEADKVCVGKWGLVQETERVWWVGRLVKKKLDVRG